MGNNFALGLSQYPFRAGVGTLLRRRAELHEADTAGATQQIGEGTLQAKKNLAN